MLIEPYFAGTRLTHAASIDKADSCLFQCFVLGGAPPVPRFRGSQLMQLVKDYLLGSFASVLACTFTNPVCADFFLWTASHTRQLEVVKTRLQLQGELDPTAPKPYKGVADAFRKIWISEGLHGIQAGIGPAYAFQVAMNGTRLGTYSAIRSVTGIDAEGTSYRFLKNIAAGASAGVFAACIGSPFYLVKTRLQAQAQNKAIAVGHQYNYTYASVLEARSDLRRGMIDAFRSIVRTEGIKGLARGMQGTCSYECSFVTACVQALRYALHLAVRHNSPHTTHRSGSL